MTESICAIYFRKQYNLDKDEEKNLISDAITHVIVNGLKNYDFNKKSFSYIQTIIKNFLHTSTWSNPQAKRKNDQISLSDIDNIEPIENILNDLYSNDGEEIEEGTCTRRCRTD